MRAQRRPGNHGMHGPRNLDPPLGQVAELLAAEEGYRSGKIAMERQTAVRLFKSGKDHIGKLPVQ